MKQLTSGLKSVWAVVGTLAAVLAIGPAARADVLYRTDDPASNNFERFNNSEGTETEDNWVANAFVAIDGGTILTALQYRCGESWANRPVTAAIYTEVDQVRTRVQTTDTTVLCAAGDTVNITLSSPVTVSAGTFFYGALLIRGVTGDLFPFWNDRAAAQGSSYFDVGPDQGAPYDLDQTGNITVNGAFHPVVHADVQSPGNTVLRVIATAP